MTHDHGDFDAEKEREFCVREVPANLKDWDIYHIFKKFGVVDNVRFPINQDNDLKFCFVSMMNVNGASAVREALVNFRLNIGNGVSLRVNDVRGASMPAKNAGGKQFNNNYRSGPRQEYKPRHQASPSKKKVVYTTADLYTGTSCEVRVVASPYPINAKTGLTFHVMNVSMTPDEEYTELQKEMNDYCTDAQNAVTDVEVGDAVIYYNDSIAYRATRTKKETLYLVDMGRELPYDGSSLFRIQQRFAVLPTLVIECSLANAEWKNTSLENYNHIRYVIQKWGETDSPLKATLRYFKGNINMVAIAGSGRTNLAESLQKRGDIVVIPEPPQRLYTREAMYNIRDKVKEKPVAVEIKNAEGILLKKSNDVAQVMKGLVI